MKCAIPLGVLFALSVTAADAAVVHAHAIPKKAHTAVSRMHAVRPHYARAIHGQGHDGYGGYEPLLGYFFGTAPQRGYEGSTTSASASSYDSPSVDASSNRAEDAAAAIQSSNDEAALNTATAAAEQQNEAAQAAAQQTENNANSQ